MTSQTAGSGKIVLKLAEMAARAGDGETGMQGSFMAAEIGLNLAWKTLKIVGPEERNFQVWKLGQNLRHFNEGMFTSNRIWADVKEMEVSSLGSVEEDKPVVGLPFDLYLKDLKIPRAENAGFVGFVLREHSAPLIKEAAALVCQFGSEEVIRMVGCEGQSFPPELFAELFGKEQVSAVSKERGLF